MSIKGAVYSAQFILRQKLIGAYYGLGNRSSGERVFETPSRVLFVLAGLIGDSVMSLPAIAEARRIWPTARISVLGKSHNRDLLKADRSVDEIYVCDADPMSIRKSAEIKELKRWLNTSNFDAAIILLGDQYSHLLAGAKIPVRVGVKGTLLGRCLTHTYDIGSPRTWGTNERLGSLRVLGYETGDVLPIIAVDAAAHLSAGRVLSEQGLGENEKYAAVHPFGSTKRQWWDPVKVVELAAELRKRGVSTVLIGGKETISAVPSDDNIVDTTGKLSIPELVAVIDRAELVVTTDSGPFHIAGGLRKEIVGLFRSRRPEHAEAYPKLEIVFGSDDRCASECEWDRCATDPCRQMQEVSANEVLHAINVNG